MFPDRPTTPQPYSASPTLYASNPNSQQNSSQTQLSLLSAPTLISSKPRNRSTPNLTNLAAESTSSNEPNLRGYGRQRQTSSDDGRTRDDSGDWPITRDLQSQMIADESQTKPEMTLGKCMCCDSQLRFPVTVPCFRCTKCDTINDIKPYQSSSTPRPFILTIAKLKSLVAECRHDIAERYIEEGKPNNEKGKPNNEKGKHSHGGTENKGWARLEQAVKNCFRSWEGINNSFDNVGKEMTLTETGIALSDVREAYKILLNSNVSVVRTLMQATDSILKRPGRPLNKKEDIRFLMIILENPLLMQHNYPEETQYHHNITKRIFGLISCLSDEIHHYLVNWFSTFSTNTFRKRIDLVNSFITYRLNRVTQKYGSGSAMPVSAYETDWRISRGARVMALLFSANMKSTKVPIFEFYNTMVDYINLIKDYDSWQARRFGKFSFCQYPFLISMGSKIQIMELDAQRQMALKMNEALLNSILYQCEQSSYLKLNINRKNIVRDSLTQLQQNESELKKTLRVKFEGEEGVDAGGLRKEWFLLLVRELFGPQYGMFTWDNESNMCWFNPGSFETSDQYYLVGIVLGLAIYNSTILDIHLPLACYKKLLNIPVDIEDLQIFRPLLVKSLKQLLTFDGDVEETMCMVFVVEYEVFGERRTVPLIPGGENIPVTNQNRAEFVEKYTSFILNESVESQFEWFRKGFYHVCGGNALSLFRPEELELLILGSPESLDVEQLRSVTVYENCNETDPMIQDFWSLFKAMDPFMQRKLLTFVTGSDRIPATGTANMIFRISCVGGSHERLPTAHTCFNQLCLQKYPTRESMEQKLITAITQSEGFYFK